MNPHLAPSPLSIRVAALFTSAAMTTVIFGSQLGLAVPIAERAACALRLRPRV